MDSEIYLTKPDTSCSVVQWELKAEKSSPSHRKISSKLRRRQDHGCTDLHGFPKRKRTQAFCVMRRGQYQGITAADHRNPQEDEAGLVSLRISKARHFKTTLDHLTVDL